MLVKDMMSDDKEDERMRMGRVSMVRCSSAADDLEDRCGESRGLMAIRETGDSRTNHHSPVPKHSSTQALLTYPI